MTAAVTLALAAPAAAPALAPAAAPAAATAQSAPGDVAPSIVDGSARRSLDRARRRWKAYGAKSYAFTVNSVCNQCFNGRPEKIRVVDGVPRNRKSRYRTVARMFGIIEGAIKDKVFRLDVQYHRRTGVPVIVSADDRPRAEDDLWGFSVEGFRRLGSR
jgi:DNA polymerase IIIc chi subunit